MSTQLTGLSMQDLEAQRLPASALAPATTQMPAQSQPYARAGRGGAGNFHDPAAVPEEPPSQIAERAATAVAAPSGRSGLTGRGGVGNWSDTTAAQKSNEARKEEQVTEEVVRNVDAELTMPPKIYTPPLREDV